MTTYALRGLAAATLVVAPVSARAAELVTNGGFETNSLAGWSQSGLTDHMFTVETFGVSPVVAVPIGRYQAALGPQFGVGNLFQTLNTVADQLYTITFSVANVGNDGVMGSFTASFNGVPLLVLPSVTAFNYRTYTFNALATTGSTVLNFATRHDNSFFVLDGVSVQGPTSAATAPVPEPATWALMIVGFAGLGAVMRRRSTKITFA